MADLRNLFYYIGLINETESPVEQLGYIRAARTELQELQQKVLRVVMKDPELMKEARLEELV